MKQSELLDEQTNVPKEAHNSQSSEQLVEVEEYGIFKIVTVKEMNKSFISLGYTRISEYEEEKEKLKKKIDEKDWELLTALCMLITERMVEDLKK